MDPPGSHVLASTFFLPSPFGGPGTSVPSSTGCRAWRARRRRKSRTCLAIDHGVKCRMLATTSRTSPDPIHLIESCYSGERERGRAQREGDPGERRRCPSSISLPLKPRSRGGELLHRAWGSIVGAPCGFNHRGNLELLTVVCHLRRAVVRGVRPPIVGMNPHPMFAVVSILFREYQKPGWCTVG